MRKVIIDKDVKIEGLMNRFPLDSLVAGIENGMVFIKDIKTNQKELLENYNEIIDDNNNLYGNNIQDTVDVLNAEFKVSNIKDFVIPQNSDLTTNIKFSEFVSCFAEINISGGQITPTGTIDNTNVSTREANLINGNLTDLTYNNSNAGTTNKELPAIDLGSSQDISEIVLHWWNNTYTASNYKIQGSNDGNNWTDIVLNANSTGIVGTSNNPQRFQTNVNYRYIRPFCVQGNNASWCVVSELQVFSLGGVQTMNIFNVENVIVSEENGFIKFTNNSANNITIKIVKR